MKSIQLLFLGVLVFHYSITNAQKNFEISNAKELLLPATREKYSGIRKIPFKNIIVTDYRYDTTKLGYLSHFGINKIIVGNKSSETFTSILNNYFQPVLDPASGRTLYIFIKTFWLQKDAMDLENGNNHKLKINNDILENSGGAVVELDVFSVENGDFKPLLKIKDNFYDHPFNLNNIHSFFFYPFDSTIKKISTLDVEEKLGKAKIFRFEEIRDLYISRFEIPAIQMPILKKGIFLSFEDFKQNKPAHEFFTIRKSKKTDEVYILENGKEELLIDFWGLFDDTDIYIKLGFGIFKLIRQNNTWDLYGSKYVSIIQNTYTANVTDLGSFSTNSERSKKINKPLQINMDTGKVY